MAIHTKCAWVGKVKKGYGLIMPYICRMIILKMNVKIVYKVLSVLLLSLLFSSVNAQNVAVNFDGSNDYIQSNFAGISGANARTVEAWIRTTGNADPNAGGKQMVITDWGDMSTGSRFTFNLLWNNALRIEVGGSGLSSTRAVNDGSWHHVAVVFDPNASLKYRLLVDGKLDTSGNISTSINTSSVNPLLIGMRNDNTNYFAGDIDEVRVFNTVRTDSAIKADMKHELCVLPSGLVAYYKLNEGVASGNNSSKATATDYSGGGKNGTLYNFALSGSSSNWISGNNLVGQTTTNINAFACTSYKSPDGKYTWTKSGTYKDTLTGRYSCDSFIVVKLTIGSSIKNLNRVGCDSFVTNSGKVYTSTGLYTEKFTTARGCDSTINYNITINNSSVDTIHVRSCVEYVANSGNVYDQTGYWTESYSTVAGCDSVIVIDLIIDQAEIGYDTITTCDSAKINGKWYYKSAKVEYNTAGKNACDSIHNVELTVHYSKYKKINAVACDTFTSSSGNHYTVSGAYKESFASFQGCDSTIEYVVKINHPRSYSDTVYGCGSIMVNGKSYTNNQHVIWTIKTVDGCDSSIDRYASITKIDTSVLVSGNVLTANQSGATYAWLDCQTGQKIAGASANVYTATQNGLYAAIISLNNCVDTSNCHAVNSFSLSGIKNLQYKIVPNPSEGNFEVIMNPEAKILKWVMYDNSGKLISESAVNGHGSFVVSQNLAAGIYTLSIITDLGSVATTILVN